VRVDDAGTHVQRFARLEHYSAGLGEQARKDREESRQLWRETQRDLALITRRLADLTEQFVRSEDQFVRSQDQFVRFQEEAAERDRKTDERIQALVSAMGEWMRKPSN